MANRNRWAWYIEQGGMPPAPSPGAGVPSSMPDMSQPATNISQPSEEDISDDPELPEMPDQHEEEDFEIWKIKFIKDSIKGDPNLLMASLDKVRYQQLDAIQDKFVSDQENILRLRQNSNILQASNEIRKLIKTEFDRTNPASSLVQHITTTLEKYPLLNEMYLKCLGLGESKHGQHRKMVASLIGAVQVGNGGQNEDLVFEEQDYSIRISTRFNARWGDVNLGRWYLRENDPQRFLKPDQLAMLEGGSPEEKDVLRRRVYIESISKTFRERAFVINVVGTDGTVAHLGWDLGTSLKAAHTDGKLVVRMQEDDEREAFIDEEGAVIRIPKMSLFYVKEGQGVDHHGRPEVEELEFITLRDGVLYLTAQLDLIKEAAMTMQGLTFKETLWQGNPADVMKIIRNVPKSPEMLLRT